MLEPRRDARSRSIRARRWLEVFIGTTDVWKATIDLSRLPKPRRR
jgi:hypothetical protein